MAQIRSTTRKRRTALEKAGDYIHQHGPDHQTRAGMYYVRCPNGRNELGMLQYKNFGPFPGTPEGLAEAKLARDKHLATQIEQRKQALPLGRQAKAMTLNQWTEHWLDVIIRANSTATTYDNYGGSMRRHVLPHLGKLALVDLTKTRIEKWRQDLLDAGVGAASVEYALKRLKTCLQAAMQDSATTGLKANPAWYVKLPEKDDVVEDDYQGDPADMPRMIAAIGDSYLAALPQVTTDAGLRRSEISALHWRDVDWDNKRLNLRWHLVTSGSKTLGTLVTAFRPGTKSSKGQPEYVELSEVSIAALREARVRLRKLQGPAWKAGQSSTVFYAKNKRDRSGTPFVVPTDPGADDALVFPMSDGMPYKTNALGLWFVGICSRIGIKKSLHGLRHDCGSFLLAGAPGRPPVPLTVVSKHMRHANPAITAAIYSHMLPKDARLGANAFDALWASLDQQAQAV